MLSLERSIQYLLNLIKGVTDTSLPAIETSVSSLDSRVTIVEDVLAISPGTHKVIGMDIYVQDTEPTSASDWVWIDTGGLNLLE